MPDDDDTNKQSEDEALEADTRPDDIFNPDTDEEKLPEDNDPPAAAPKTPYDDAVRTHPVTDDPPDRDEIYNGGLGEATGLSDTMIDSGGDRAKPLEPEE